MTQSAWITRVLRDTVCQCTYLFSVGFAVEEFDDCNREFDGAFTSVNFTDIPDGIIVPEIIVCAEMFPNNTVKEWYVSTVGEGGGLITTSVGMRGIRVPFSFAITTITAGDSCVCRMLTVAFPVIITA